MLEAENTLSALLSGGDVRVMKGFEATLPKALSSM